MPSVWAHRTGLGRSADRPARRAGHWHHDHRPRLPPGSAGPDPAGTGRTGLLGLGWHPRHLGPLWQCRYAGTGDAGRPAQQFRRDDEVELAFHVCTQGGPTSCASPIMALRLAPRPILWSSRVKPSPMLRGAAAAPAGGETRQGCGPQRSMPPDRPVSRWPEPCTLSTPSPVRKVRPCSPPAGSLATGMARHCLIEQGEVVFRQKRNPVCRARLPRPGRAAARLWPCLDRSRLHRSRCPVRPGYNHPRYDNQPAFRKGGSGRRITFRQVLMKCIAGRSWPSRSAMPLPA